MLAFPQQAKVQNSERMLAFPQQATKLLVKILKITPSLILLNFIYTKIFSLLSHHLKSLLACHVLLTLYTYWLTTYQTMQIT